VRAIAAAPAGLRLVVVGEGSMRETLERLAADLGASERVVFAGSAHSDDLLDLYAGALAVVYVPFLQTAFETTALTPTQLGVSTGLAAVVLVVVEIELSPRAVTGTAIADMLRRKGYEGP